MADAPVGDDVYGDDPSVLRLQSLFAERIGKEASLFFPSGTMANQACLRTHTRPGDVVLASVDCHILKAETGAAAALSGLQIKSLGDKGDLVADEVRAAIHPDELHHPATTLLALENTHNFAGGHVLDQPTVMAAVAVAKAAGLAAHLDGARLFNAAVASGESVDNLAAPFDTVSVCLSKGLGAPVGSLVAADRDVIAAMRRTRKMLGGGMRQAGILAAAGIHALEHQVDRLAEDHANAARLAEGLDKLGLTVEATPETNIVMFRVPDMGAFLKRASVVELWVGAAGPGRLRAVTHLDVSDADIEDALQRVEEIVAQLT
jgi:threonine aldolase